jgi:hypothetical protein
MIRFIFPICLIASVVCALGCNRGPEIVPVSGKITIDGQPLTTGFITMYQEGYRPATAQIESDGSFHFKTLKDRDGCLLGEHPITVTSNEVVDATTTKFFIPPRYGDLKGADMKLKIDGATDRLAVDLTWKGSGHREPYAVKATAASSSKDF